MKTIKANFETLAACLLAVAAVFFAVSFGPSTALAQAPATAVPTMETRSAFATAFENQLRQRGIVAYVQLDGDERDVLRVEWQTISRHDIYGLVNSGLMRNAAPAMGFRTMVFTNGEQRWEYDLARESMVFSAR
ncbi:MAG TPA: hypothetical protein VNY29_05165 [Terriglobales bacterium]|jgi:hypothetical protein|nr:hypothetical protein [Terriglobales bacterium]